jgi:hypothetical protein
MEKVQKPSNSDISIKLDVVGINQNYLLDEFDTKFLESNNRTLISQWQDTEIKEV